MTRADVIAVLSFAVAAISVSLLHNFTTEHFPVTLLFDSLHYLQVLQPLVQFEHGLLHGQLHWNLLTTKQFLDGIRLDGPVLVSVFAPLFLITGHHPTEHFAKYFVVFECLFQGLTVAIIWLTAKRLANNSWLAALAATFWTLYPPAILATERLLTEPLALCLVTSFAFLLIQKKAKFTTSFTIGLLQGILCALIFMLKSALSPALILAIVVRFVTFEPPFNRKSVLLAIAAGIILTLTPWAVFTKVTTGKMLLTSDREPGLNLGLGFDRETGGTPVIIRGPFCEQVFDLDYPLQSAAALYKADPIGYLSFFAGKAFKLVIFPWNDFKDTVFGLDAGKQFFYHLMLLGMGIFGLGSFLYRPRSILDSNWNQGAVLLALMIGHIAYCLVQPNPRYMITSMPIVAIFAAVGLVRSRELLLIPAKYCVGVSIVCGLFFVAGGYRYAQSFDYAESTFQLRSGESITRQIELNAASVSSELDTALLLVDGDNISSNTQLIVNGEHLADHLLPIYELDTRFYSHAAKDCLMTVARYSFKPNYGAYRVWRVAVVPRSLLKDGKNQFSLSQIEGKCTIYGDKVGERTLPSLLLVSLERMGMNPLSLDGRPKDPVKCANVNGHEKFVFRNKDNISRQLDSSLRIKLLFTKQFMPAEADERRLRSVTLGQRAQIEATPAQLGEFTLDTEHLDATENLKRQFVVPPNPASGRYYVTVRGQGKHLSGENEVAINCRFTDSSGKRRHAEMASHIAMADEWQDFVDEGLLRTWDMKELKDVETELYPKDWNALQFYGLQHRTSKSRLRNLGLFISPCYTPDCDFDKHIIL